MSAGMRCGQICAWVLGIALATGLGHTAVAQDRVDASEQKNQIRALNEASGETLKKSVATKEKSAPADVQVKLNDIRTELLKPGNSKLIGGKPTFVVGTSKALRRPLNKLAGTKPPADLASRISTQVQSTKRAEVREQALTQALEANGFGEQTRSLTEAAGRPAVCNDNARRFDWREHGAVTAVKDQGTCGSCWTFAAIAAMEGSYAVRTRDTFVGSEQQLLSCSAARRRATVPMAAGIQMLGRTCRAKGPQQPRPIRTKAPIRNANGRRQRPITGATGAGSTRTRIPRTMTSQRQKP